MVVGKRSCVRTALTVFDSIVLPGDLRVSEYVRERMGVDTCDARRAINSHRASTDVSDVSVQAGTNVSDLLVLAGTDVSDVLAQASTAAEEQNVDERGSEQRRKMVEVGAPGGAAEVDKKHHRRERVDCPYRQAGGAAQGLAKSFPEVNFPIVEGDEGFGLVADEDVLWEADYRESKHEVADRLTEFLHLLYRTTEHRVLFVVLHSGSTRGALQAVGREAYRPQNGELVPLVVQRIRKT